MSGAYDKYQVCEGGLAKDQTFSGFSFVHPSLMQFTQQQKSAVEVFRKCDMVECTMSAVCHFHNNNITRKLR